MSSSIRTTVHESLPYIDKEPTPAERSAAEALITHELSSSSPHSPPSASHAAPDFTPLLQAELERVSKKEALAAIDLARYEVQDEPPSASTPSDLAPPLSRAYATHTYLQGRQTHLQLLDAYGKNAWLVGNWQAEADLAALERDLAATKKEIDVVNIQRRRLQDEAGNELRGLEETWKKGVGRVLETEVATEALRQQVLEKQRAGG
ncbi:Pre-mRNA-splicing factor SPF27 [Xylaria grammica]|nr:Pre-mRNA-splicing factor SPF27 [Xylaria grammica]